MFNKLQMSLFLRGLLYRTNHNWRTGITGPAGQPLWYKPRPTGRLESWTPQDLSQDLSIVEAIYMEEVKGNRPCQ